LAELNLSTAESTLADSFLFHFSPVAFHFRYAGFGKVAQLVAQPHLAENRAEAV